MEKKKYVKPSMEVYDIQKPAQLLVGSYSGGGLGYLPGQQPDDEKKLA